MIDRVKMPISMGASNHSLGNITFYYYKRNIDEISLTIQVGAGSNSRSVRIDDETRLEFAHWGCGTSLGIPTHLSAKFLIIPENMLNEAKALEKHKIRGLWNLITCDPDAIVVTPYHRVWSQLTEMTSKLTKGTCGSGAGRAYAQDNFIPDMTIHAIDLVDGRYIEEKLRKLRAYVIDETRCITKDSFKREEDVSRFLELQLVLNDIDDTRLKYIASEFRVLGKNLHLLTTKDALATHDGTAIVEHSHGVLSDSEVGFKPYVSSMRTLPQLTDEYLWKCGYKGQIWHYAVHSAYEYRHGPGPMPTEKDQKYRKKLGIAQDDNRWRGPIRVGDFDMLQLLHAIKGCGGSEYFDGFWLTCFDRIMSNPSKARVLVPKSDNKTKEADNENPHIRTVSSFVAKTRLCWNVCTGYYPGDDVTQMYDIDEPLTTELLESVTPYISNIIFPADPREFQDKEVIFKFVKQTIEEYTGIPLDAVSYGTSEDRKIWSEILH